MRRAGLILFALVVFGTLLLTACQVDDASEEEDAYPPRQTYYEPFETPADVAEHGGYLVGQMDDAFVRGFTDNGYWLGEGNNLFVPAKHVVHPEHGTIEFWICPKNRWHDGALHHILSIGSLAGFSISKDPIHGDLRVTLQGKSMNFARPEPFVGPVQQYRWRSGWNHVALTWRNLGFGDAGELVLIINGEVRNQMVDKLPRIDTNDPIILGGLEPGTAPDAIIDELKIYNYSRPYWEFQNVAEPYELDPPFPLRIYPTPQPVGLLPGEGFALTSDTRIVVGPDVYSDMLYALERFNDVVERRFGFRCELERSGTVYRTENVIAVGTLEDNGFLARLNDTHKLPATSDNPGPSGYLIEVLPDGIAVAGGNYAGAVKGLMSLAMLVDQHAQGVLPNYLVVDFPDMPFRATVLSVPEGLDEELKLRMLFFASLGLSHVVIDTDDFFDMDDPLIVARVRELFDFARSVGLDPVPLLPGISRAAKLIEKCAEAGVDCSEDGAPDTYCPNEPFVYTLLKRAVANIVTDLTPSAIHIGHDDIKTFNKDDRCKDAALSPAELFVEDIDRHKQIIRSLSAGMDILVWWDMINPMHNGSRLTKKAPGADAPDPPDILAIAPRDVIWCPWKDVNYDQLMQFLFPMLTYFTLSEGMWGEYTAGPTRDDTYGAYAWIRHGRDFNAIGFLNRPMTDEPLGSVDWLSLPAAAEFAWSYNTPFDPEEVWYDYAWLNERYGVLSE